MLPIGRLGNKTATEVQTNRYYEQIGLMPDPGRTGAVKGVSVPPNWTDFRSCGTLAYWVSAIIQKGPVKRSMLLRDGNSKRWSGGWRGSRRCKKS